MVDNIVKNNIPKRLEQERAALIIVLAEITKAKRGISITGLVKNTELNRSRIRTTLASLKASGQIAEEPVGMARIYYIA